MEFLPFLMSRSSRSPLQKTRREKGHGLTDPYEGNYKFMAPYPDRPVFFDTTTSAKSGAKALGHNR